MMGAVWNAASIAILAAVLLGVGIAVAAMVARRKKGKSNCGCQCDRCNRNCPYRPPENK